MKSVHNSIIFAVDDHAYLALLSLVTHTAQRAIKFCGGGSDYVLLM